MVKLVPADQPTRRRKLVPADTPEPEDTSFLGGLVDSFTQGAAFGFGDELTAAEAATLGEVPGETWQDRYNTALAMEREQNRRFRDENRAAATAAEVAGGVATALTPVGAIGSGMKGGVTLGNMAKAAAAGAGYGGLYGFGTGEGGAGERAANVPLSAGIGAAGGAVAVPVAAGVGRLSRALAERSARRGAADTAGMSPRAYNYLRNAADVADTSYPGGGAARIRQGGPDAMLADVMPGQADFVANVGAGAPIARRNLTERVGRASGSVDDAMNATFGQPRGVKEVAREISGSTSGARSQAYDAAYNSPIDYSTGGAGERILGILDRIPRQTLRAAIDEANDAMTAAGVRNKQILAGIADDGTIAFREMPNVQQLDEIKKALQTIGRENVDQFGRPTARGIRADGLARELRDALGEAVPAYNEAVRLGGDKIAQDQALELGRRLLTGNTSVEDAVTAAGRLQGAERARLREGVRYYLDDLLGRVKATRSDPNIDAREAWRGIQELSSRNNREKLRAVLGEAEADAFLARIDEAARAFEVRAAAAGNSQTMPRETQRRMLESGSGMMPEAPAGPPRPIQDQILSVPGRIWNRATGNTPAAREARMAGDLTALAERITGLRGEEAVRLFEQLLAQNRAIQSMPQGGGRLSQILRRSAPLASAPLAAPLIQP
jgi:hypothetical protein